MLRRPAARQARMTRRAISPRLATRTEWKVMSHPEEPETGLRGRDARGHLQAHREDSSGVDGVDDAVVPQPRGRVVGGALGVELLADRCAEGGLVLGRPLFAALLH